ncbi:MAG TPA: hypothetical protein ENI61_07090 [Ignavibacteria bacterium]|nr:hypothetical protein [Ignavibacteria bacterium]
MKETYKNKVEMILALNDSPIHYMLFRRLEGVKKELNVKTPFNALRKWYELKPEFFNQNPSDFKNKLFTLE